MTAVGSTALLAPGFGCGKPRSNSAALDHSAYKSRTPSGILAAANALAGEPLLQEPAIRPRRRTLDNGNGSCQGGTSLTMVAFVMKVAEPEPRCFERRG